MISEHERDALTAAILENPAYRLAYGDADLMEEDDLRPLRLQMELLKPERALRHQAIRSTVVVFGSARIVSPEVAQTRLSEALSHQSGNPSDVEAVKAVADADRQMRLSRYYTQARRLATLLSQQFQQKDRRDFVVVTGGGPGVMEAANRGAFDVGARSAGFNITLPNEQKPNPFITPDLAFRFHYFALRKMHLLMRAKALVAFPGGFGTLDEVFEVLTLVQTGKMPKLPIVLFGPEFWNRAIDFDFLVSEGMIAPQDRKLFTLVETAEQAISVLLDFYHGHPPEAQQNDPKGDT
ncbi:LOG family protein [Thioclava sp.]|uniref:LOG family protein n=1 Tax=Thioclava sp. TaxID=1933450 RepID=UPI003AA9DAF2